MLRYFLLSCAFLSLWNSGFAGDKLLLCGMDEVFVIQADPAASTADPGSPPSPIRHGSTPEKLWSWRARDHPEIPEAIQKTFATTDEIKVLEGGAKLLITSSSGGAALLEYPSGKALWHARVPNAHSIEALPGNLVVVASSVSKQGDRLILFDLAHSNEPLSSTPLPSAHGVIWDESTRRLWALGFDELRRYELITPGSSRSGAGAPPPEKEQTPESGKPGEQETSAPPPSLPPLSPGLKLEAAFHWPGPGKDGHDLQSVPGSSDLLMTCESGVWLFDRKTETFRPHPDLAGLPEVKSVSIQPKTGRMVWTMAGGGEWWTHDLHFLRPDSRLVMPDEKLYKVRWFPEAAKTVPE